MNSTPPQTAQRSLALAALALACSLLPAQDDQATRQEVRRMRLRVVAGAAAGAAIIDRGKIDLVENGDLVEFMPRGGGTLRGRVIRVDERTSLVELEDRTLQLAPGTGGEMRVPVSRYEKAAEERRGKPAGPPADPPDPKPGDKAGDGTAGGDRTGERPPSQWKNQDREYRRGQPLLASSVNPAKRSTAFTGRVYAIGEFTDHFESEYDQSFVRFGAGVDVDNPAGFGGRAEALIETNYRTEYDEDEGANLFIRRLSYTHGGTRFDRNRIQVGRFLQYGFPEFSTIDGVQFSRRILGNNEVGASVGILPVPDERFDGANDLQSSLWYLWKSDQYESTVLGVGYQNVLHKGDVDRNLVVLKGRSALKNGWSLDGRLHVDINAGEDDIRDEQFLISQVVAHATRTFDNNEVLRFGYRRLALPELRRFEFIRPQLSFPNRGNQLYDIEAQRDLADDGYDRLFMEGWFYAPKSTRWHGYLSGFNDEEYTGGAAEGGFEVQDALGFDSSVDLTGFFNTAEHVDVYGIRANYRKILDGGTFNVFYEFANHKERDFPDQIDDSVQHRLRVSRSFFTASGWDADFYLEGQLVAQEIAYTAGMFIQRRF